MQSNYRKRIYNTYLSGRKRCIAPSNLKDLKPRIPYLTNIINRYFPEDKQAIILDLGCGHGALVYLAKQMGYLNITGIDISSEQIEVAKKLCIEGVDEGDIMRTLEKTPYETIDCLITFDVIEHLTRDEILSLVDLAFKAIKPKGRWIIHTPNAESPFGMRMRYWDLTHETAFTHTSISQLLLSSGFAQVNCFEERPIVHGLKSMARCLLWTILRSLLSFYLIVETGDIKHQAIFSQNLLSVAVK